MKIIQLIQKPQLRGAEMFTVQLSNHLLKNGHEVILVSLFRGEALLDVNVRQINLRLSPKFRWLDINGFTKLANVIKEEEPDIIQANAGDTLKYAILSRLVFGWKQPIVFRNASMVSLYVKNSITKKLNGFLYAKVDAIASVSKQSKLDLNQLFPITKGKSRVIPIGIEVEKQEVKPNSRSTDTTVSINRKSEAEIQLVHVGGFSFEKNHKGLLNIFKRFLIEYPYAKLNLIGDGLLRNEIEELAKELELLGSVNFLGYQPKPMQFVSQADVLVLPSIIEGLPGVILEAFYCKIPVVAYDVGGVGEVLRHDVTGKLVNKSNEEAFVKAIKETLENISHTKERIDKAYQVVEGKFRNDVISKKFLRFYEEILERDV